MLAFGVEPSTHVSRIRSAKYVDIARSTLRELHARGPLKVLDVACGEGILSLYAGSSGIEFTGLDLFIHTTIEEARSKGYHHLVHGDIRPDRDMSDFEIEDLCGFYFLSCRTPLENQRWWYRLNGWYGRACSGLTAEVNVSVRTPGPWKMRCAEAHGVAASVSE